MRSSTRLFWLVATYCSLGVAVTRAQDEPRIALTVRAAGGGSERCFELAALSARVAHYASDRLAGAAALRLELSVEGPDSAELFVYRASELVSRRRFAKLPEACTDRRDAVALSIALALEAAVREEATAEPESAALASAGETTTREAAQSAAEQAVRPAQQAELQAVAQPAPPIAASVAEPREADRPAEPAASNGPSVSAADGGRAVLLHLGGRWVNEALPTPVWTGALGIELWLARRLTLDISGFASTLSNSTFAGGQAQAWLSGAELLGCLAWKLGVVASQGCLGATAALGRAHGTGYPLPESGSATLLTAASTARFGVRWPDEGTLSLRAFVSCHLHLVRPELEVTGASERLSPSWIGGSLGMDMIVALQ